MIKNYLIFGVIFLFSSSSRSQNNLIINLVEKKKEVVEFMSQKRFANKPLYDISEEKYLALERDAISISGTDKNVKNLKNFIVLTSYDEELLKFLKEKKVVHYFLSNKIVPPPGDILPTTPNFIDQQSYLQANPGLNVEAVWNLGFTGQNITIHNIEYGFNKNHEEFNNSNCNITLGMDVNSSASVSYTEHGTATMGVLFGNNGSYGITGIAHGADQVWLYPEWQQSGYSRTNAITQALNNSKIGDVVVLEMQAYGFNSTESNPRFVPAEFDVVVWNLTKALTDAGRIVVAAAGNGFQDLDSVDYQTYMSYGDSGAIITGGGTADLNHSIIQNGSTFGSRVDVQGWYSNVRTTGAMSNFSPLLVGNDFNQSYMSFSGTSSATAQLGGVVAVLQSYYYSLTNDWLTSQQMRNVLKNTGISQGGDLTKNIGSLPNMLAAVNYIQQNLSSESFTESNFLVYPNPSKGIFSLATGTNEITGIEVYDVTGKIIVSKRDIGISNSEIQIDLTPASQGIYFVKITANNQSTVKRIIKE